jgi:3-mercaptopyruvate sulfurtransferase SseA
MRFNLKTTAAVLVFGLAVLTGCQNGAETGKVEKAAAHTNVAAATPAATAPQTVTQEDEAPRITLAEAKKEFDAGTAVFVDTRGEAAYNNERIKGAVNVSMENFEAKYKSLPTDKKIIAYCS